MGNWLSFFNLLLTSLVRKLEWREMVQIFYYLFDNIVLCIYIYIYIYFFFKFHFSHVDVFVDFTIFEIY